MLILIKKNISVLLIIILLGGCTNKIMTEKFNSDNHGFKYHNKTSFKKDKLIVFIHGLGGDHKTTWTYGDKTYWLDLLDKDMQFKNFDLATLSYPTSTYKNVMTAFTASEISNNILHNNNIFDKYNEIHIVAHSLGGIIAQNIIIENENKDYISKIKSVTLLSTPSNGSVLANIIDYLKLQNKQIFGLKEIQNNTDLQRLKKSMNRFMSKAKTRIYPKFYVSYENSSIVTSKDINHFDRRQEQAVSMPFNHFEVAKPKNKDHYVYKYVRNNIIKNSEEDLIDKNSMYTIKVYGYQNTKDLHRLISQIKDTVNVNSITLCDEKCDKKYNINSNYVSKRDNILSSLINSHSWKRNHIIFNMNDKLLFEGLISRYNNTYNDIRLGLVHNNLNNEIVIHLTNDIFANASYENSIFSQPDSLSY